MKIIHLPFTYYPDKVGGTEIYVETLINTLSDQHHVDNVVAAPSSESASYTHRSIPIHRYALSDVRNAFDLYGLGDATGAHNFGSILDAEKPDIVHLHALTRGVSTLVMREAKQRDIPVIFTYHTPTVTCLRGTLLLWGDDVCDGKMQVARCTGCLLHRRGINKQVSQLMGFVPTHLGTWLRDTNQTGGVWTAFSMTHLTQMRHTAVQTLFHEVDQIVALNRWTKELLLVNGVTEAKISVCRHGLSTASEMTMPQKSVSDQLRLVFFGRLHPTKGIDTVIKALLAIPDAPVQLDVFGVMQSGSEVYVDHLKALCANDARIRFLEPVPHTEVVPTMADYDVLVVPSRWLETGPLVILEAFLAGIPVLGSNLGGIADQVVHDVDGLLMAMDDVTEWSESIRRLSESSIELERLTKGVRPPRSIDDVASEMLSIYERVLSR